jgi:hypothetical protein
MHFDVRSEMDILEEFGHPIYLLTESDDGGTNGLLYRSHFLPPVGSIITVGSISYRVNGIMFKAGAEEYGDRNGVRGGLVANLIVDFVDKP